MNNPKQLDIEVDTDLREDLEIDDIVPGEDEPEDNVEDEFERQARQLGWHPKEEYLGPPGKWRPAKEFIERGQNILPVLRDNNKRLLERTSKQDGEIQELKRLSISQNDALKELRELARSANQRGYERALSDLKEQQRRAVENADVDTYDKLSQRIDETEKARALSKPNDEPTESKAPVNDGKPPQEILDFIKDNQWFTTDKDLNEAMQREHVWLRSQDPGQPLEENLIDAKERVMKLYPDKFNKPKSNGKGAPPVGQGGGNLPRQPKRTTNSIDSIDDAVERAEAKRAYEKIRRGMPEFTESDYMATYNDPKGDVLDYMKNKKLKDKSNVRG